ncbi:hypothetical protein P8452_19832 [Trifolium repens]|nr:hypothetical protein P8452_19832 [Trifolium repens]
MLEEDKENRGERIQVLIESRKNIDMKRLVVTYSNKLLSDVTMEGGGSSAENTTDEADQLRQLARVCFVDKEEVKSSKA